MSYQPTLKFIRQFVKKSEVKPTVEAEVKSWLECNDLGALLEKTSIEWVLVHLLSEDFFLNSFSISNTDIELYRTKETMELGDFSIKSSSIDSGYSFSSGDKKYFYDKGYKRGIAKSKMWPLFFSRSFDGYKKDKRNYYEVLQDYIHFADLHWMPEKSAFCVLNDVGDVEERVLVIDEEELTIILFERKELEKYLQYREHFVCRFIEVKRAMPEADWDGRNRGEPVYKHTEDKNSWIRLWPYLDEDFNKSFDLVNASDIILPKRSIEELENEEQKHETFIIHDWKNKKVVETSCERSSMDSYFEDTGKPFETSPAFFKADVLLKYKGEPEKYELKERSIYCRGVWSLKTYDINEEGQVHTYICYLRDLPHREQLHWKQYNEVPKGKIAARAFKTDFEAEWVNEYNPLSSLKNHFRNFPSFKLGMEQKTIWRPKEDLDTLLGKIHYVSAGKNSEYKDFLMALTILVVDGFDVALLRSLVKENAGYKENMASLGCLRLWLLQLGLTDAEADEITAPLRNLQGKRSKFGGHGGAQPEFDLVSDSRSTLEELEKAIKRLIEVISSLK